MNQSSVRKLFEIAHQALAASIRSQTLAPIDLSDHPELLKPAAAFVTIYRRGMLRGCIGHILADKPLYQVVCEMVVAAATVDPRFPRVLEAELPETTLEISVLSPFEITTDFSTICIGKHGLLVQCGEARGLLLPQVAVKQGWNADRFLQETCRKAQLPSDAYKDENTQVAVFTATVLTETQQIENDK